MTVAVLFNSVPLFVFPQVCRTGRVGLMGSAFMNCVAFCCNVVWCIHASPLQNYDVAFLTCNICGLFVQSIALTLRLVTRDVGELGESCSEEEFLTRGAVEGTSVGGGLRGRVGRGVGKEKGEGGQTSAEGGGASAASTDDGEGEERGELMGEQDKRSAAKEE